jgi:hypothetical protein
VLVRWLTMLCATAALAAIALAGCGNSNDGETTATTVSADTKPIAGDWTGTLTQKGLPPFRIAVSINGTGTGVVAYTGINCGGIWTAGTKHSAGYEFTEQIEFGSGGSCKGTGTVDLTPSGSRLAYTFAGGGITSRGVLSRTTARRLKAVFRSVGTLQLPS